MLLLFLSVTKVRILLYLYLNSLYFGTADTDHVYTFVENNEIRYKHKIIN